MYLAQFAYLSIWVGIWLVVSTFWLLWKMEVTLLYSCLPEWLFSGCIDGFLVTLLICWGAMSLSSTQWYHVSGRSVSSHHWWLLWARLWPLVFSKRDEWLGWCLALNPLTEKLPSSPFFHGNARLFLGGRPVMTFIRRFSGGRVWPIQGLCLETSYIFFFRQVLGFVSYFNVNLSNLNKVHHIQCISFLWRMQAVRSEDTETWSSLMCLGPVNANLPFSLSNVDLEILPNKSKIEKHHSFPLHTKDTWNSKYPT